MPGHIKLAGVKRPVTFGIDKGRKFDHNVDAMRYEIKLDGGRSNGKTFLQQYLYEMANNFGLTKTQYKKILGTVRDDKVKEFLIEQFKIKNSQTDPSKLVKFLNNLEIEPYEKKEKIEILDLD